MKRTALLLCLTCLLGVASAAPARGGTMIVSYKDDVSTLDPAIGYDLQNWPLEKMVFDALLDYAPGTTNLEPRLAAKMPSVSADNKTYTFALRQGVKFHNGREMTADDVVYTLTRVLDPKTKSPGQSFYTIIAGAQAFVDGKAKTVSGLKANGKYSVSITLDKPNAAFLNIMAMNFAFIVPKEAVKAAGDNFGHKPMGTGPFILKSWTSGQALEFTRNPNYFYQGLPYLDGVTLKVGVEPSVAYLGLTRGEVDLLGDGIPPAQFLQVRGDPKFKNNIVSGSIVSTVFLTLNTQMKPLNDVRVRQAINLAVDRSKMLRIINQRGQAAVGYLPPLMPGFDKAAKPYAVNVPEAKKLLAASGLPQGFSSTLYVTSTDPWPRMAQSIQQDLAAIGVKVEIKAQAQSTVEEAAGTPKTAPMVLTFWAQDYPDPSDFYWPVLSCKSAVQGGWNWPFYCNKALDARSAKADQMAAPSAKEARLKEYAAIFAKLSQDVPWVALYHDVTYMMHSDRLVGTRAELLDPTHNILYERLAIKGP